jgi:hypothetical protein
MPIFKTTNYESDLTQFMRQFLQQHPEELDSQKKGRSVWWDKKPEDRSPAPSMRNMPTPRSGGAEHVFTPLPDTDSDRS